MNDFVIFDIDGTLADLSHRLPFIRNGNKNWNGFFGAMDGDGIIEPIRRLNDMIDRAGTDIVLCTGRPEPYRQMTETWLARHGVQYKRLFMRPTDDTRPDHVVKAEILAVIRAEIGEPIFVVDDRPSVVAMWRENGIACLQCRDWNEAPDIKIGLLFLMVGPTGAGKSTWLASEQAKSFGIYPECVVSSDQIRVDLCGDFKDQTRNDEVFHAVHAVARARITCGLRAVIDATNIRRKDRMVAAMLTAGPCWYMVIDRPMEEKRRDGGWRNELGFDLLAKHEQTFRSQEAEILKADGMGHVTVYDLRVKR